MIIEEFQFVKYHLKFKEPFKLSTGTRDFTTLFIIRLKVNDFFGYGEISLPPYLGYDEIFIENELNSIKENILNKKLIVFREWIKNKCHKHLKSAFDVAYWDLICQLEKTSPFGLLRGFENISYQTAFTLTKSDNLVEKIKEYDFPYYKLKLTGESDSDFINEFLSQSDKPFYLDPNRGWKNDQNMQKCLDIISPEKCLMIEQPFSSEDISLNSAIYQEVGIPIIADEDFHCLEDLNSLKNHYQGINIKLMKVGGISPIPKIIQKAKDLNMKVMIGCMTSTSLTSNAISIFSSAADFIDLDATYLTSNDPFDSATMNNYSIQTKRRNRISPDLIQSIFD